MKYQEGLKETKDFLKTTPEPQIREICNQAGLTEKETEMIVQKFRKGKSRLHSSYDLGMSESRYSDFFPMYKDDVSKYVEHAYLFLNDKDFKCKYSKEKWYAKKRA